MTNTIGVPKEIKPNEGRVSLTPKSVNKLTSISDVIVETDAGKISGFNDSDYILSGAKIVKSSKELYAKANIICKVKEPLNGDLLNLGRNHLLFGYLHLASSHELTVNLMDIGLTAIAMEMIRDKDNYPLLTPMSEFAGQLAYSKGMEFLGNKVKNPNIVVIGCGVVGEESIKSALESDSFIYAIDVDDEKLKSLNSRYKERIITVNSDKENTNDIIKTANLLIGAVLVPGKKPPTVINNAHIKSMAEGSVIVDVAIDQGGCVEGVKANTHSKPYSVRDGVKVSAIANLPGSVPSQASIAISNQIENYLPFFLKENWIDQIENNKVYSQSLQVYNGSLLSKEVSDSLGIPLSSLN